MSLRSLVNPSTGLKYVEILPKPQVASPAQSSQSSGYVSKPKNLPPKRKYTKRKKAPTPPVRHVNSLHDLGHQRNELMDHYKQQPQQELPFAILHELELRKHIQHPVSDIRSTQ